MIIYKYFVSYRENDRYCSMIITRKKKVERKSDLNVDLRHKLPGKKFHIDTYKLISADEEKTF